MSIQIDRREHLAVLSLNRPAVLNAMTRAMVARLEECLGEVAADDSLRALLLIGEGRAFSAGVDLNEAEQDVSASDLSNVEQGLGTIQSVTRRLMDLPIPTIAALNGLAVGMGAEICIACDVRVAATSSYLWFSEARRGLFQSNGVMYLLPRLIGHSRATEWMMSCRKIRSEELLASGLVAQLFPDAEFRRDALRYAAGIATQSPLSLRLLKEVGQRSFSASFDEVLELEVAGMGETMRSSYAREGLRAFAEKREPKF